MRKSSSLRFRLMMLYITIVGILLSVIIYIVPTYYSAKFEADTTTLTNSTLTATSKYLTTYMDELDRLTLAPYYDDELMGVLKSKASNEYSLENPYTKMKNEKKVYAMLPSLIQNVKKDILSVTLLTMDGERYISTIFGDKQIKEEYQFEEQDWFDEIIKADGRKVFLRTHEQDYMKKPYDLSVFSAARLIKDPDSRKPIGIIIVDANTKVFEDMIKDIKINADYKFAILDEKNDPFYVDGYMSNEIKAMLKEQPNKIVVDDESYLVLFNRVDLSDWNLAVMISSEELSKRTWWVYKIGIYFAIAGLILTFILYSSLSSWIVQPFQKMIKAMEKFHQGDFQSNVIIEGPREIEQLSTYFNYMKSQLNDLIEKEYRTVLRKQDAEYRALQAQMQPHFLYNTLNGFIGLSRLGEREKLEKAILSLSNLLRYTVNNNHIVTIEEEFKFLQEYCNLQKIRFQDRLCYSIYYEEEVKNIRIPKLLIQPFVENAIIHGIEPLDRQGNLAITATVCSVEGKENLHIEVIDNGDGFDQASTNIEKRVGISNTIGRLKMLYSDAEFHMEVKPNIGVKVSILIPI